MNIDFTKIVSPLIIHVHGMERIDQGYGFQLIVCKPKLENTLTLINNIKWDIPQDVAFHELFKIPCLVIFSTGMSTSLDQGIILSLAGIFNLKLVLMTG